MKTNGNLQNNPFMPQQSAMAAAAQPQQQTAPAQAPAQNFAPPQNAPMPGGNYTGNNMAFDVDLTDVQTGFTVPDGDYLVKCVDVEQGVSQAGNSQFIWTFAIVGGDYDGKEFKSFTALTPAAMWKVAETVTALGLGVVGQKIRFSRSDVMGRQCIATMEESEYKGTVRSSIVNVRPVA